MSVTDNLVGKTISEIWWNHEYLLFVTDQGVIGYYVDGDCCSTSYFYDFYGVQNLLRNGPIVSTREIYLDSKWDNNGSELTQCYGFEFVTKHPTWGEVTSVLSFRNDSNGYYGGMMHHAILSPNMRDKLIQVTEDQHGD